MSAAYLSVKELPSNPTIMKETIDFTFLNEEEYSAINEAIQKEIVGADRDNNWLPSYSASYVESANDMFLVGDFIEPRLPYFRALIFPGGRAPSVSRLSRFIGNPHGIIRIP